MSYTPRRRGVSILELVVGLAVLSVAFVLVTGILHVFASGMKVESVNSDQATRVRGTLYDIGMELRQATACSPNFYLEQRANVPPMLTFDLIDSIDANGNYVWGSKITYRLAAISLKDTKVTDVSGIARAQLIRDEVTKTGEVLSSVVEDSVPYQFTNKGVTTWGFNVSRNGSSLAVTLSRFVDTGVAAPDSVNPITVGVPTAGPNTNTFIVTTASTSYYLRNPQAVLNLN